MTYHNTKSKNEAKNKLPLPNIFFREHLLISSILLVINSSVPSKQAESSGNTLSCPIS